MGTIQDRMYEALWAAVFLLIISKLSHTLGDVSYLRTGDLLRLRWWMAMFLNGVGVYTSIRTAGILFGVFGFALEYWGASVVFEYPKVGLLRILVGAVVIVVGRPTWQGLKELWAS